MPWRAPSRSLSAYVLTRLILLQDALDPRLVPRQALRLAPRLALRLAHHLAPCVLSNVLARPSVIPSLYKFYADLRRGAEHISFLDEPHWAGFAASSIIANGGVIVNSGVMISQRRS